MLATQRSGHNCIKTPKEKTGKAQINQEKVHAMNKQFREKYSQCCAPPNDMEVHTKEHSIENVTSFHTKYDTDTAYGMIKLRDVRR